MSGCAEGHGQTVMWERQGAARMAKRVLIDEGKSHLEQDHRDRILSDYAEVLHVGGDGAPESGSDDTAIAAFCEDKCCDLLTGDKKAYTKLLAADRIEEVRISRYVIDKESGQQVYRVRMH